MYTKVLLSIKERSFNTSIFLIRGSTGSAGPNTACSNLEKSRASHGWNLDHTLDCGAFWLLQFLSQLCQAVLCENQATCSNESGWQGCDPRRVIESQVSGDMEQGLAVIDLEALMPVCLGSAGLPDGFCTSGIHLFHGFVQWPTAAKLTDQSTKMQWCDCQLFRDRQISLKGFMGRATSPSSSGSYSSHPWYNVREKECEMCLF